METRKEIGSAIWRMNQDLMEINEALMENGGELTPDLEEKIELSAETQVEVADGIRSLMAKVDSEDKIIGEEIKRLQALKKARANALASLKEYLMGYMLASGIKTIETPTCKVTVANGPEKVLCNEAALVGMVENKLIELGEQLPPYITVEAKVNKTVLKDFLKQDGAMVPTYTEDGVQCPAAALVKSQHLLIK